MREPNDLRALYGLSHNPFSAAVPADALWKPPGFDAFVWKLENVVLDGGFALLSGEPGLGKSKVLQLLDTHLRRLGDELAVGVMQRPQSTLGDFYRELGALFGVNLSPANRYGGFRALRDKWNHHVKTTLLRPVLLIDEAQEMAAHSLTELRILTSANFDSDRLLTVLLCGDCRLPDRFRSPQLLPLGSRIGPRWVLEPYRPEDLRAFITHALAEAGAPHLMTPELCHAMAHHSAGNLRVLCNMGVELLAHASYHKLKQLDESTFLNCFHRQPEQATPRSRSREVA